MTNFTTGQHKWFISILVVIVFFSSLLFGMDSYGGDYLSHNVEIINLTLAFVNTALVIVIAAILVKIEDDLSTHNAAMIRYHEMHSKSFKELGKKRK